MKSTLTDWLRLHHTPRLGPVTVSRLLTAFGSARAIHEASRSSLQAVGLKHTLIEQLRRDHQSAVNADLAWANKASRTIICLDDPRYPLLLRETHGAPIVLYAIGDVSLLDQPQIAMVGSRQPTPAGQRNAMMFASELAAEGLTITSGLANGIDTACHRGALRAKGTTIAVLGSGLNHIYPRANLGLAKAIVDNGSLLLSEFSPTTKPLARHFPQRNRIISGLSLGVIVVEATVKSGSLITARLALEQDREVFAVPSSIHNPQASGCLSLIRQGAKLIETTAHVLEEFTQLSLRTNHRPHTSEAAENQAATTHTPAASHPLLPHIDFEATPVDVIISRCGLTAAEVSSMLLSLELDGTVALTPGGYCRICA